MKKIKKFFGHHSKVPYIMLLPGLIGIMFTNIIPSLYAVILGFFKKGPGLKLLEFIGFGSYKHIFNAPEFWQSLGNTFFWSLATLVLTTVIGFGVALLINRPLYGRTFFRTMFFIPWVTPPVVVAMVWKYMFDETLSPINHIFKTIGIINENIPFLGNPAWSIGPVTVPMLSVLAVNVWVTFPFMMIMILAALQSIPASLYEAAEIDGANGFAKFRHITVPSVLPVLAISLLLQGIWQFNSFNLNYLVARGGPLGSTKTLAVSIYQEAFMKFDYGAAGAISGIMLAIVIIPAYIYIRKQVRTLT